MFSIFQRTIHLKQSIHLVIFCFFLYKLTETILQYGTRIEIYKIICLSFINSTKIEKIICSGENDNIDVDYDHDHDDAVKHSIDDQLLPKIQRLSGYYLLTYRILLNLPATIACFVYGICSNKYGHKISMLIPCLGAVIACTLFSLSILPNNNIIHHSVIYILIGGFIYGICGKSSAITMGANSYITDMTNIDNRTCMLGRLLGINCLGLSIGTLCLGLFLTFLNYSDSIIFCALSNLFIVLILLFFVVDSKSDENTPILHNNDNNNNRPIHLTVPCTRSMEMTNNHIMKLYEFIQTTIIEQFYQSYKFLFSKNFNEKYKLLLILLFTVLFNQMTKSGEQDIILLYLRNEPTLWTSQLYSYYLTCYYGCMFIHLTLILPIIEQKLTLHDTTFILIGLLLKIIRLLLFSITKQKRWIFFGAIIGSAAGYITSATRSIISKLIYKTEISASFALISIFETMANLFGGLLFTIIYNYTLTFMTSFIFILDALLHVLIMILFIWLRFKLILFEKTMNYGKNYEYIENKT
uniref:Putative sugar transporter n=1 Tax=Schistosoma mansoni TaxID=6183 RepID=A0A3Q0KTM8_SCHMA